ncbi:MAG: hypothetical protein M1818_003775 [Claussenomyces sp. TS43310]|nr:MAG: hypothetical protein M1818_003775 [Claussenomyces sp. TS43310]
MKLYSTVALAALILAAVVSAAIEKKALVTPGALNIYTESAALAISLAFLSNRSSVVNNSLTTPSATSYTALSFVNGSNVAVDSSSSKNATVSYETTTPKLSSSTFVFIGANTAAYAVAPSPTSSEGSIAPPPPPSDLSESTANISQASSWAEESTTTITKTGTITVFITTTLTSISSKSSIVPSKVLPESSTIQSANTIHVTSYPISFPLNVGSTSEVTSLLANVSSSTSESDVTTFLTETVYPFLTRASINGPSESIMTELPIGTDAINDTSHLILAPTGTVTGSAVSTTFVITLSYTTLTLTKIIHATGPTSLPICSGTVVTITVTESGPSDKNPSSTLARTSLQTSPSLPQAFPTHTTTTKSESTPANFSILVPVSAAAPSLMSLAISSSTAVIVVFVLICFIGGFLH